MADLLDSLGAGILAGIISPLVLAFLQQYVIWKPQKRIEIKQAAFDEAVLALAMYEADALDINLQANKPVAGGLTLKTNFRPETTNQIQKALAMVEAFFSPKAFSAFSAALSSGLSIEGIPNEKHSKQRTQALRRMADELELESPFSCCKRQPKAESNQGGES
jgi:hypothetical protein